MINDILAFLQLDLVNALSSLIPVVLALVLSFVMGILIFYVYTKAFRGVVYSHAFAVSLSGMTILTTMITLSISSNIALSLGMVGALSIVRYRTAIKDPMDLLFLFWTVATGITIGAKMHYLAVVGAVVVIVMLWAINRTYSKSRMYILVVHYSGMDIGEQLVRILHGKRYQIKSKTIRQADVELALEIVIPNDNLAFVDTIKTLPSVYDVTLIQYS